MNRFHSRSFRIGALGFLGAAAVLAAAEPVAPEPISAERPGFTNSTDTMARGVIQIESGILISRHSLPEGSIHGLRVPSTLLRYGLGRSIELRWGSDGFARDTQGPHQSSGRSDMEAGVKVRVRSEQKYVPALAVIASLSAPTGSPYFTSGGHDPSVALCWSKSLPDDFDAGGTVNLQWQTEQGGSERGVSLVIGRKLSRAFRAYAEVYRSNAIDGDARAHWVANMGVTRLIRWRAQVDAEIGHNFWGGTAYWFAGVGFALRL